MISFNAKMYNVTTESYEDSSPVAYTFCTYYGVPKEAAGQFSVWPIVDGGGVYSTYIEVGEDGTVITKIPSSYYDGFDSRNVGTRIEFVAVRFFMDNGYFPTLRLCTSDSLDDFYLEWSPSNPTSLLIKASGSVFYWANCIAFNMTTPTVQTTTNPQIFIQARNEEDLANGGLIWSGCWSGTSPVTTHVSYAKFRISVQSSAGMIISAGTYLGSTFNGDRKFYKTYDGMGFYYWTTLPNWVGICSIEPLSGPNGTRLENYDARFTNNDSRSTVFTYTDPDDSQNVSYWGFYGTYRVGWDTVIDNPLNLPQFPGNTGRYDQYEFDKYMEVLRPQVTFTSLLVYEYLQGGFGPTPPPGPKPVPDDPDVDPDNPPDPDEPPEPIPPDNPDPYYDPTSDPDSPEYKPTKDPDSPEYDPSEPDTPYRPPSTEGGGEPPIKPPEDPVTPPPTPPSHAINSRFVTLYTPSLSQLNDLAAYLWSPAWSIDGFKKIFANPIDCILGLMIFPALAAPSGSKEVNVGNLSTGITMSYVDNQYVELNCGSFEITEYYASYLDYDPYTKIEIYLPYIGTHRLSADDVMAKTIQLKYMIDLLSGACVAFLVVDGTTLYTFTGSCATPIPVSGNDWSNMVNGILSVAGAATAAVISGGTAATMAAGAAASTSLFVSSHKEHIRHGGSVASAAGLMSIQTPYLIVTRPRQALPIGQNSFQGYPSFMTESLGSLSGYTEVESCHLEHIPCTDEELKEIERLLKGGVLF